MEDRERYLKAMAETEVLTLGENLHRTLSYTLVLGVLLGGILASLGWLLARSLNWVP